MNVTIFFSFVIAACVSISVADRDFAKKLSLLLMQEAKELGIHDGLENLEISLLPEEDNQSPRAPTLPPFPGNNEGPKVNTTSGLVTGATQTDVHVFYEIPYAEPPVGSLRFQSTRPLSTPRDIDASTNNQLQCYQTERVCIIPGGELLCSRINMKEDCLILNIYVPNHVDLADAASPPDDRLPVMFYIHGGSFNHGTGQGVDGRELANVANVILVTINYRLGPLGFLVNKEAGQPDIVGNQGIKDQQMALKWVHDNIENFGGDKSKVTIFGGSAGAQSVMFHTLSATSAPYYWNAIQESNPAYIEFHTAEESQWVTNVMLKRLCNESQSRYDCLMNIDPIKLVNRQIPIMARSLFARDIYSLAEPFRPIIDGSEFTDQPLNLYKAGKWNSDKDIIIGVNTEELDDIQYIVPERFPTGNIVYSLVNYYIVGIGKVDKVFDKYSSLYPPDNGSYIVAFSKQMSHMFFVCPSRAMARLASQTTTGGANVYFYANEYPVLDGSCKSRNNGSEEGCYLASHGDETRFVMRTVGNPSEDDIAVENQFSTYWGSFARTGSPSNGLEPPVGEFPEWPQYMATSSQSLKNIPRFSNFAPLIIKAPAKAEGVDEWANIRIKAPTSEVETEYEENVCDFWDSLGVYMEPITLAPTTKTTTTRDPKATDPPMEKTTSAAGPQLKGIWLMTLMIASLTKQLWAC